MNARLDREVFSNCAGSFRLGQMLGSNAELARKLEALEKKYDVQLKAVSDAIRQLVKPPEPKNRQIGFCMHEAQSKK